MNYNISTNIMQVLLDFRLRLCGLSLPTVKQGLYHSLIAYIKVTQNSLKT